MFMYPPEIKALILRIGGESRIELTWKSFNLKELKLSEKRPLRNVHCQISIHTYIQIQTFILPTSAYLGNTSFPTHLDLMTSFQSTRNLACKIQSPQDADHLEQLVSKFIKEIGD